METETSVEVLTRLPEIRLLDGELRYQVMELFGTEVPDYFWHIRASEEHHPFDERGHGGLWLHTKRVVTAFRLMADCYSFDGYTYNCGLAASLLHDALKYGQNPQETSDEDHHDYIPHDTSHLPEWTQSSHDVAMASLCEDRDLPHRVAEAVASHGGGMFGHDGSEPVTDDETALHHADMIASNDLCRLPVHSVCDELQDRIGTEIPTIVESDE